MSTTGRTQLGCAARLSEIDRDFDGITALDLDACSEADLIDGIAGFERLKRRAEAQQARMAAAFDASVRARQEAAGVRREHLGRGVADQIALARQESPRRGQRHLGLARALVHEMPSTLAALERGDVSEWGATLVARETAVLTLEERREVDARLAPTMATSGVSEQQLGDAARAMAQQLDPAAAVRRAAKAEADRCMTIRPAPDCMTYVTAHLPVQQGVAVFAALDHAAKSAAAQGDPRGRGQVMADALVAAVIGSTATSPGTPAVTVELVMSDTTLLGDDDAPAVLPGHGTVPAAVARRLVAEAGEAGRAWVRRLYATPDRTRLVAMESRARLFPAGLARFLRLADQVCATPWCDAPIRHIDHVVPALRDGPTSAGNGQGLCEHCNLVKEHTGSVVERHDGVTTTVTATGHRYASTPPPLLGLPPPRPSPLEASMRRALAA